MGSSLSARMSWSEICSARQYSGRWVALGECRYENDPQHPTEATVLDADDDLGELCSRVKRTSRQCCTILFCEPYRRARTISHH